MRVDLARASSTAPVARLSQRPHYHLEQGLQRRGARAAAQVPQRLLRRDRQVQAGQPCGQLAPYPQVAQPREHAQRKHKIHPAPRRQEPQPSVPVDHKSSWGGEEWTPCELRHTFASIMSDNDVPIDTIANLVGHWTTVVHPDGLPASAQASDRDGRHHHEHNLHPSEDGSA